MSAAPLPQRSSTTPANDPFADPQIRKRTSRPLSLLQAYQAPLMNIGQDTIPELQPIFTFLNSHGNKLYQEGYFLKLDDQNTRASPSRSPPSPTPAPA